jgi:uncharacterized protein (TIGR00369 family)
MKWVTYRGCGGERTGVLAGDTIYAMPPRDTLLDLIRRGADGLRQAGQDVQRSPSAVAQLAEVTLLAPIPRPPSIRDPECFLDSTGYFQVAQGAGRQLSNAWSRIPGFYFACPARVLGPYDDANPSGRAWQDRELEVAAVIGTGGRDLAVEQAEQAIIGYTIFSDLSARDVQQLEGRLAIGQGDGKNTGVTLGPYLVTPDELEPYRRDGKLDLQVTALVNDIVIGSGSTAQTDWSFGEVISYASRWLMLTPGDVICSGTASTCTLVEHLSPTALESFPGWLRDGDVVTLQVQGLGETRQTVRASSARPALATRPNRDPRPAPGRFLNVHPPQDAIVPFTTAFDNELGLEYTELSPDGARARLEVKPTLLQPMGLVHGGVYCSIIESMASGAAYTWLAAHGGGTAVGVNNNTDFLRSISSGTVYGTAEPIQRGRRQQLWQVTITDSKDRVVARGQVRLQNLEIKPNHSDTPPAKSERDSD